MRSVRLIALAGVLTAPLPLIAQNEAAPYGFSCGGEVRGDRGEAVSVQINLDPNGRPIGTATATWTPPQHSDPGRGNLDRPDIAFSIDYAGTAGRSIGEPLSATVTLSVFAPPRQRVAPGKLSARLNALSAAYRFGEAAFAPLPFLDVGLDDSLPGTATRAALLDLPQPGPRWLDVQVLDAKRRTAASTRFVLDPTASRDALFAQAWSQAQTATANYKSCAPTLD
jgi:hypothetical protein